MFVIQTSYPSLYSTIPGAMDGELTIQCQAEHSLDQKCKLLEKRCKELEVVPERTVFGACWPRKRGHAEGATPSEYLSQALEAIEHAAFTGKGDKPKVQLLLAKLEWLIRSAVEEDASISGRDGRTVDPAVVRQSRERAKKEERDDDGAELLTLRREV